MHKIEQCVNDYNLKKDIKKRYTTQHINFKNSVYNSTLKREINEKERSNQKKNQK